MSNTWLYACLSTPCAGTSIIRSYQTWSDAPTTFAFCSRIFTSKSLVNSLLRWTKFVHIWARKFKKTKRQTELMGKQVSNQWSFEMQICIPRLTTPTNQYLRFLKGPTHPHPPTPKPTVLQLWYASRTQSLCWIWNRRYSSNLPIGRSTLNKRGFLQKVRFEHSRLG